MVLHRLAELFEAQGVVWGISDTARSPYEVEFSRALVYGVPHGRMLSISGYRERLLEGIIGDCAKEILLLEERITSELASQGIPFLIAPLAQDNESELKAKFPFKDAATKAGIGWIGKNDLLVTRRYGPRVRLGVTLFQAEAPIGPPQENSSCPADCDRCVAACPHGFLLGATWVAGMDRTEFIDHSACNESRSRSKAVLHRKSSCGLCLVSCPIGLALNREEPLQSGGRSNPATDSSMENELP